MSFQSFCSKCGGQLIQQDENTFKCKFCDSIYREDTLKKEIDALSLLLDEKKREEISNLKRELWKKANEEFLDSKEILRLCQEVKKLVPDDFYANFYEAANSDNEDRLVSMLECMDVIEHYDDIEDVIEYCLKSITPKNMLAICNLIEKAFKQNDLSKYNEYRTRYDEKCVLINDCVYDPAYPRDVFVCYSSKDMPKVEELVKFLEEQGLLCFVAMRNLQHGRGAVQNYWNALHTAIESCKCVVFLSSTNSRDMHCDALQELRYVLSLEQKLNKKIKRIEYLLENYTGAVVERNFKRIFEGLEYCYDVDTVYDRIMWDDDEVAVPEVQSPEISVQKEIKYCVNCGKENLDSAKFCSDCGKDVFVATHEEYVEQLKKQREELEALRQSLASANQQVEEQKRIAEEQKKQVEEHKKQAEEQKKKAEEQIRQAEQRRRQESDSQIPQPSKVVQHDYADDEYDAYLHGDMQFEDVDPEEDYYEDTYLQGHRADVATLYTGNEFMELIKGQNVILPEGIRKARVTVENDYKLDNVVADLYVFMLDNNDQVLSESDLIFFGNTSSLNKSVSMTEDEDCNVVDISFNKVNQDVSKIRFIMSMNMEDGRIRNFSMVRSSSITVLLEERAFVINLENFDRFESVLAIEFLRIRNKWKLSVQVAGFKDSITAICGDYGIDVE